VRRAETANDRAEPTQPFGFPIAGLVLLNRSSFYCELVGENPVTLALTRLIDEPCTECPFVAQGEWFGRQHRPKVLQQNQ
jgi:hypothetical protein